MLQIVFKSLPGAIDKEDPLFYEFLRNLEATHSYLYDSNQHAYVVHYAPFPTHTWNMNETSKREIIRTDKEYSALSANLLTKKHNGGKKLTGLLEAMPDSEYKMLDNVYRFQENTHITILMGNCAYFAGRLGMDMAIEKQEIITPETQLPPPVNIRTMPISN